MVSSEEKQKVNSMLIFEIIGRPAEHLVETLKTIIGNIGNEPGVKVLSSDVKEPAPMKDSKDMFTTFAEVDVEVDEILYLAVLMFKYMPAYVEISSPEKMILTNQGMGDIFNEIVRKLHGYDEVARVLQVEKQILENKLREVLEGQKKLEENISKKPVKKKISKKK